MKKNVNIVQFLPYFPPHKGGLETHADEWGKSWTENGFGEVYNIITDIEQHHLLGDQIEYDGEIIGYCSDGVNNLIVPSIEIIPNFPTYKSWSKKYKLIIKYLKEKDINIVLTRTRFFLTTFSGGLFAKNNNIKWCHVEHGSSYVVLNSKFKTLIAKIYDITIGKWVFKKANILIGVSNACKYFINKEFSNREVKVIYRGFDFINIDLSDTIEDNIRDKFNGKIIVGFVGRLYKWKNVESLINAYNSLDHDLKDLLQIVIVGDGEDFERLNEIDSNNNIYFTGGKLFKNALKIQSQFDIHFHTSSPGGGLAGTLIQGMNYASIIVSTPYEGAKEVIVNNKNGILLNDDSIDEMRLGLVKAIKLYQEGNSFLEQNKKIINKEFNWKENIKKYHNIFKNEG